MSINSILSTEKDSYQLRQNLVLPARLHSIVFHRSRLNIKLVLFSYNAIHNIHFLRLIVINSFPEKREKLESNFPQIDSENLSWL